MEGSDRPMSFGTAWCVGVLDGVSVWVTNGHVIDGGHHYTVLIAGVEYPVVLDPNSVVMNYNTSPQIDLALLVGEDLPASACLLASEEAEAGDELFVRAYPNGSPNERQFLCEPGPTFGKDETDGSLYVPYGATVPGCSGSPVFNMEGEVVGVIWAFRPGFHISQRVVLRDILEVVGNLASNGSRTAVSDMPGLYVTHGIHEEKIRQLEEELRLTKEAQDLHFNGFLVLCGLAVALRKRRKEII
jgi:hypothetical protein